MAKANAKKVSSSNASLLQTLFFSLLLTNLLHLISSYFLPSPFQRHFYYYLVSTGVAGLSYGSLWSAGAGGKEDLGKGLWVVLVDYCFLSAVVWAGTGAVWRRLWGLYWLIPTYGLYKAYNLLAPFILPRLGLGGAPGQRTPVAEAPQQQGTSKRQEKMEKRAGRHELAQQGRRR